MPTRSGTATVGGQAISNPGCVVDPDTGLTKLDVARHYASVGPWLLPHLAQRPVALLRAPGGIRGERFFQKHLQHITLPGVRRLDPALDPGHASLLEIVDLAGLMGVVQINTLELHTWNARHDRIERPDRFVLDLDPGEGVTWPELQRATLQVHKLLTELGLVPFLKTSGGRGLHVLTPIPRRYDWDTVLAFSRQLTEHLARRMPERFVAVSEPKNRIGRVYADYLRNARGATTVAAWSVRARPDLGVSVPIAWRELERITSGAHWTLANLRPRLRIGNQPWHDWARSARPLGPAIKRMRQAPPGGK